MKYLDVIGYGFYLIHFCLRGPNDYLVVSCGFREDSDFGWVDFCREGKFLISTFQLVPSAQRSASFIAIL
jgi:hypothetical protein